jgi:hypothetical protein
MKILAQIQPYTQDIKTGLTIHTFLPLQEVLQWPNMPKRKFKRNTERMSFVITCRAWKALFQGKENKKKKKNLLHRKENSKEKRREKNTAGKSSIEKSMIIVERF